MAKNERKTINLTSLQEEQRDFIAETFEKYEDEYNQAAIFYEGLQEWRTKKELGAAITGASGPMQAMFNGDKEKLLSAVETIKTVYISLMTTTSQKLEDKERELTELYSARINELKREVDELKEQQGKWENEAQTANEAFLQAQANELQANEARDAAEDKFNKREGEIEKLETSIKALQDEYREEKARLHDTIDKKDQQIDELSSLEVTNETLRTQNNELETTKKLNEQEINSLKATIDKFEEMQEEYKGLLKSEARLAAQNEALVNANNDLNESNEELKKSNNGLKREIADSKAELANSKTELAGVKTELSETKEELKQLKKELAAARKQLESVNKKKGQ